MRISALLLISLVCPASLPAQPVLLKRASLADSPVELASQIAEVLAWEDGNLSHRQGQVASEAYKALFKLVGSAGLSGLQTTRNDSIAIQAAWQEVTLSATDNAGKDGPHDRQKLDWFVGFLEGRARVKLPQWWSELLLGSRFDRQGKAYIPNREEDLYHDTGFDHVRGPRDTTLKRDGEKLILMVGAESVELPGELLPQSQKTGVWCEVSALMTREKCYIAVHDHLGYPFQLTCLDRLSGLVRWKTTVCGTIWSGYSGTPPKSYVSIIEHDDRVLVFGAGWFAVNFEAFQAKDGVNLFRFATSYVR